MLYSTILFRLLVHSVITPSTLLLMEEISMTHLSSALLLPLGNSLTTNISMKRCGKLCLLIRLRLSLWIIITTTMTKSRCYFSTERSVGIGWHPTAAPRLRLIDVTAGVRNSKRPTAARNKRWNALCRYCLLKKRYISLMRATIMINSNFEKISWEINKWRNNQLKIINHDVFLRLCWCIRMFKWP